MLRARVRGAFAHQGPRWVCVVALFGLISACTDGRASHRNRDAGNLGADGSVHEDEAGADASVQAADAGWDAGGGEPDAGWSSEPGSSAYRSIATAMCRREAT